MKLHVHVDAQPWRPSEGDLRQIRDFFDSKLPPSASAWIWPRRLQSRIYGHPVGPHEFRAVTRGDESHLFVDASETPRSVAFLLAHELCHQVVDRSPTLGMAFDDARPQGLSKAGDAFHSVDAEERFCDGVAARLFPGVRYDREWWRGRFPAPAPEDRYGRYIGPYQGSALRNPQVTASMSSTSRGWAGPGEDPCERWISFERSLGTLSAADLRDIETIYARPDASVMNECAILLNRRIKEEATRRGVSKADVRKTWKDRFGQIEKVVAEEMFGEED